MNRHEFMEQLERLLADISYAERAEAIQYYNDYFDDAGVENEQEVIKALGNPAKVAQGVKNGLNEGKASGGFSGEFTENGYHDANERINELQRGSIGYQAPPKEEKKKLSGGIIALIVILCIIASPAILGAAGTVFGILVAILAIIFSIIVGFAAVAFALLVCGVVFGVVAFTASSVTPFGAVLLVGSGLILLAVGVLFIMLTVWLIGIVLPWVVNGIIKLCKKIFSGKKGGEKA